MKITTVIEVRESKFFDVSDKGDRTPGQIIDLEIDRLTDRAANNFESEVVKEIVVDIEDLIKKRLGR
jgi:hypothetical protein